jgi:hypothetical protein
LFQFEENLGTILPQPKGTNKRRRIQSLMGKMSNLSFKVDITKGTRNVSIHDHTLVEEADV